MPAPAYAIAFEHHDSHLRAHVTGPEDTLEVSLAYWTEIAAECALYRVRRLLVVEDLGTKATRADTREMVEVLAGIGFAQLCIAYVDRLDDDDVVAHGELHARHAGLTARAFRNEAIALDWLLDCELPPAG